MSAGLSKLDWSQTTGLDRESERESGRDSVDVLRPSRGDSSAEGREERGEHIVSVVKKSDSSNSRSGVSSSTKSPADGIVGRRRMVPPEEMPEEMPDEMELDDVDEGVGGNSRLGVPGVPGALSAGRGRGDGREMRECDCCCCC